MVNIVARFVLKCTIAFFAFVLSLIALEVVLRVGHFPPYPDKMPSGIYLADPETGFVYKPNSFDDYSSYEYSTRVEINGIGLRDDPLVNYSSDAPIFSIGDSFAAGTGVNSEDTYARLLGKRIHQHVLNLGVESYGTREEVILFKRFLQKFNKKPKLALLAFYVGNDYYDNSRSIDGPVLTIKEGHRVNNGQRIVVDGDTSYLLNQDDYVVEKIVNGCFHPPFVTGYFMVDQSKVFNIFANGCNTISPLRTWLSNHTRFEGKRKSLPIAIPGLFDREFIWQGSPNWKITKKWMDEFISLCRDNKIVPAVMIIPSKYQVLPKGLEGFPEGNSAPPGSIDLKGSISILSKYLVDQQVTVVDLFEEFMKVPDKERTRLYYDGDTHFTRAGHKKVAEILFQRLAF